MFENIPKLIKEDPSALTYGFFQINIYGEWKIVYQTLFKQKDGTGLDALIKEFECYQLSLPNKDDLIVLINFMNAINGFLIQIHGDGSWIINNNKGRMVNTSKVPPLNFCPIECLMYRIEDLEQLILDNDPTEV